MVAGVQIQSHTSPCTYEGLRKSLVNPFLVPGECCKSCCCLCDEWTISLTYILYVRQAYSRDMENY